MKTHAAARSAHYCLPLALLLSFSSAPAWADGEETAAPVAATRMVSGEQTRQMIEAAITEQRSRRGWGIAGTVVGGGLLVAGIASAVSDSVENYNNCAYGSGPCEEESGNNSTAIILDVAGAAIMALGIYTLVDANIKLHRAQQHLRVSFDPRRESLQVGLAYNF